VVPAVTITSSVITVLSVDDSLYKQQVKIESLKARHLKLEKLVNTYTLKRSVKSYMLFKHDVNYVVSKVSTKLQNDGWSYKTANTAANVCASNVRYIGTI